MSDIELEDAEIIPCTPPSSRKSKFTNRTISSDILPKTPPRASSPLISSNYRTKFQDPLTNRLNKNESCSRNVDNVLKHQTNDMFKILLADPEKRSKVLAFLTEQGIAKGNEQGALKKPLIHTEKPSLRIESPSSLCRRRQLQQMNSGSSGDEIKDPVVYHGTPKPFNELLKGVVAYCEVKGKNGDKSEGIKAMMKVMGATVLDTFTRNVTHVVFKDGSFTTFQKARMLKVHLVSVLWLEAVRKNRFRVPERKYPALNADAFDADISSICQALQDDYEEIVNDEYKTRSEYNAKGLTPDPKFITKRRKKSSQSQLEVLEEGIGISTIRTEFSSSDVSPSSTPSRADDQISISSHSSCDTNKMPLSLNTIANLRKDRKTSLPNVYDDDNSKENNPASQKNIAKYIRNSLEVQKCTKRRSVSRNSTKAVEKNSFDDEDNSSIRLHITTSDESHMNSTKSRISSENAQNSLNRLSNNSTNITKSKNKSGNCSDKSIENVKNNRSSVKTNQNSSPIHHREKTRSLSRNSSRNSIIKSSEHDPDEEDNVFIDTSIKKNRNVNNIQNTKESANLNSSNSNLTDPQLPEVNTAKKRRYTSYISKVVEKGNESPTPRKRRLTRASSILSIPSETTTVPTPGKLTTLILCDNAVEKPAENTLFDKLQTTNDLSSSSKPVRDPKKGFRRLYTPTDTIDEIPPDWEQSLKNVEGTTVLPSGNIFAIPKIFPKGRSAIKIQNPNRTKNSSSDSSSSTKQDVVKRQTRRSMRSLDFEKEESSDQIEVENTTKEIDRTLQDQKILKIDNKKPINKEKESIKKSVESMNTLNEIPEDEIEKIDDILNSSTVLVTPRKSMRLSEKSKTPINTKSTKALNTKRTPKTQINKTTTKETNNLNKTFESIELPAPKKPQTEIAKTSIPVFAIPINTKSTKALNTKRTPKTQINKTTKKETSNLNKTFESIELTPPEIPQTEIAKTSIPDLEQFRRSTLDFVQKRSRESLAKIRSTKKLKNKMCSIVCTRLHRMDTIKFQEIVAQLGGYMTERNVTSRTTHLVASAPSRTLNMLRAVARGCWIVRLEWLYRSLEAGKWLPEDEYEMVEFSSAVQKCRIERQAFGSFFALDIFKEAGPIYVSPKSVPRCSDLKELIQLCGGNLVNIPRQAKIIVGQICRYEDVHYTNEKWILDSITEAKCLKLRNYISE